MLSNFGRHVMSVLGNKKTKTFNPARIAGDIERELDNGKITLPQAISKLRSALGYDIDQFGYKEIEKQTGIDMRK